MSHVFRVTAHMEKPVVTFGDGIALDGPLQWAAYQKYEDKSSLPDPHHEWCHDFKMPVETWVHANTEDQPIFELDERALTDDGHLWGWCTSNAQADWQYSGKTHVRKVSPSEDLKRMSSKARMNRASGQYKGANKPFPYSYSEEIHWRVVTQSPSRLLEYLSIITHIGKLANHGWGKVQSTVQGEPEWSIEKMPQFKSWWKTGSGKIIARVPFGYKGCTKQSPNLRPMRAPNWDQRRAAMMMEGQNAMG